VFVLRGGVIFKVALCGLVVACLPLDPRFTGSNLAKDDEFLTSWKLEHQQWEKYKMKLYVVNWSELGHRISDSLDVSFHSVSVSIITDC
jgi:hypothetical protein